MNNIYKYGKLAFASAILVGLTTACSDDFLTEKKNYGNFDSSNTYGSYSGASERVDNLYFQMLPSATENDGKGSTVNDFTSKGWPDKYSQSTEEFGSSDFTIFTNPQVELTEDYPNNPHDFFFVANDNYSPWGRIRNCNDVIEGVSGSTGLTEEEKNELLGQAYFFRAFVYSHLVKIYGGVPIIDYVQDPIMSNGGDNLVVPRSSTKDCIDFICEDLDKAANMLPAEWDNSAKDFGRVTAGLAEALKGQLLLFYASPLFNRADETSRWEAAYEANKAALAKLDAGHFGLVYANNGGEKNAANWAKLWMDYTGSDGSVSEAVFVTLCNTQPNVDGQPDYGKYNLTEQRLRPSNVNGQGGLTPTSEIIDLFPMADGKKPSESSIQYDKNKFWLNRDPRFYRTFAFPGVEWQFDDGGNLSDEALVGVIPSNLTSGKNYALWSYTWYEKEEDLASISTSSGYSPDMLKKTHHAVYVRKRTDDYHLNTKTLYVFSPTQDNKIKGFRKCGAPLITMRYTEVLLNFAEAAAGAGHYDEAVQALQKIRARVGYTADNNNYGLGNIGGDRAKLLSAILYERQIELAYEGKRFDDMRRWMLFDGGVGQASIKASWALTGFGGNTCTYLGVNPLNGTKRHQIIMYYKQSGIAEEDNKDPLFNLRPKALTLDEDMTYNGTYANDDVKALAEFYDNNLLRKDTNLDGNDDALTITFLPKYYFIGFTNNNMQNNVTLHQTVGWHDLNRNAEGLFDPLADTAPAE